MYHLAAQIAERLNKQTTTPRPTREHPNNVAARNYTQPFRRELTIEFAKAQAGWSLQQLSA